MAQNQVNPTLGPNGVFYIGGPTSQSSGSGGIVPAKPQGTPSYGAQPSMPTSYPIPYGPGWNDQTHSYNAPTGVSGATPIAAGPVGGYTPSSGGVPTVPSPQGTQQQAIQGNLDSFGGLTNLAGQINQFNSQQALQQYQSNLPLYNQMTGQASANIASNLSGQLPQDVQNMLAQQAAERGVAAGSPGSPNANASLLRSLGLTSLDLQNLGQTQLSGAVARTPTGGLLNTSQFFVTPEQQQQNQLLANLYASAPVPAYAQQAGFNALGQGFGRGQGATGPTGAPTQSQGIVGDILSRYAPTAGGTPSYGGGSPSTSQGYGQASNSQGGYAETGIPPGAENWDENQWLDYLTGVPGDSSPQDTGSYYPDYAPAGDASQSSYWDFTGGE